MGRIFCIVGKSGTGKDTLYKRVLEELPGRFTPVVPCTTRPRRSGEVDGENYFFVTEEELCLLEREGLVVEKRAYHTVHGLWTYFTRKFDLEGGRDYLLITTLEGVRSFIDAFGREAVEVVYLHVEDRERLLRCVNREAMQDAPNYAEVCRRYLADEEDFSEERLAELGNVHLIDSGEEPERCIKRFREIVGGANRPVEGGSTFSPF